MQTYSFYECANCSDVVFGGAVQCEAAGEPDAADIGGGVGGGQAPAQKFLCTKCCGVNKATCGIHGQDSIVSFLENY